MTRRVSWYRMAWDYHSSSSQAEAKWEDLGPGMLLPAPKYNKIRILLHSMWV